MKKLFLLTLYCSFSIICFSQKNKKIYRDVTDTLFINIEDNVYTKQMKGDGFTRSLSTKNKMKIEIKNINPFLYDIKMKEYQNDYLNEMKNENIQSYNYSTGNLAISFPEPSNKSLDIIQINESENSEMGKLVDSINAKQKAINDIYLNSINPNKMLLSNKDLDIDSIQNLINENDYTVARLLRDRDNFKKRLSDYSTSTKIKAGKQEAFNRSLKEYDENIQNLQQLFHFYQALKIQVYTPGISLKDLEKDKKAILQRYLKNIILAKSSDKSEITDTKIESFELTFQFHEIINKINKITDELKEYYSSFLLKKGTSKEEQELALNMKSIIEWLDVEHKKLSTGTLDNIITNTTILYNSINEEMFTQHYMLDEIKDKTDYVQFVFEATPKAQNQITISPKPILYKISMPIKGGVQLNVSSGIFFNVGLGNDEYYYRPTSKIDTFQIAKSPYKVGDMFKPSVGVLLQIYKRSPYSYRFGGCFGFSTNATEINYYLGSSLILGRSQRFVASIGFSGGQKEVLKSTFGEGNDEKYVSSAFKEKNTAVEMSKKFKVGTFISFTFNLWGKATKDFSFEGSSKKD